MGARECALAGLGPALLADWLIADDLAESRLVDLLPDLDTTGPDFDTGAWLLYPSRTFVPGKVRATIDFLREAIR